MGATSPLLQLPTSADDRSRVEATLRESVRAPDPYLTELASHLLVAGGKRLRPVLAIVSALADGRDTASDDVVRGGVACELVHVGSLYHDDVMDEAETRRGVETVNAKWGNLQAIVSGDFLLSRASEIAASLGTEVAGLLARTIGRLCHGQLGEVRTTYQIGRTEEQYLDSISGKTASLFATSARIGGIVAEHPRPWIDALTLYGEAFGMLFQIVDDVLDVTATDAELGKPAGHDMEEGVYTLPVLRTLAAGDAVADEMRSLLGRPLSAEERDHALALVRGGPGIVQSIDVAVDYVRAAEAACDALSPSDATDALRAAPAALLATVAERV
ncbi:MAG TPA: polyprenyl synthetase family protein [Ilumatobacteraceae bacterium]